MDTPTDSSPQQMIPFSNYKIIIGFVIASIVLLFTYFFFYRKKNKKSSETEDPKSNEIDLTKPFEDN